MIQKLKRDELAIAFALKMARDCAWGEQSDTAEIISPAELASEATALAEAAYALADAMIAMSEKP